MIISRTPFRVSFAGGGSDLKTFYHREAGCVLSTTINKYMYIAVHPYFYSTKTLIKYSKTELVDDIKEINHPIVREVLISLGVNGLDITSISDVPAGTGLGTSSSFTVGLLNVIHAYQGLYITRERLASLASEIEIERLREPIGKQDQYASAMGGINFFRFHPNEAVSIEKVILKPDKLKELQQNLVLCYTDQTRNAGSILAEQDRNTSANNEKFKLIRQMVCLAETLKYELSNNNIDSFGEILHASWRYKKELASSISNERIDRFYDLAMKNGAAGGKLLGAGGGGFLLFYVKPENMARLKTALSDLSFINFEFENTGSVIIGEI